MRTKKIKSNNNDIVICFIGLLMSLMFISSYHDFIKGMFLSRAAYGHVTGTVVKSRMKLIVSRGGDSQLADIGYKYQVQDHVYYSENVIFWFPRPNSEEFEEEMLQQYPLNKQVIVFYQRSNPQFAVLNPDVLLSTKICMSILLAVFLLSAIGVGWLSYRLIITERRSIK